MAFNTLIFKKLLYETFLRFKQPLKANPSKECSMRILPFKILYV